MKAAFYLRVSTDDQSVESQRADLRAVAKARGWVVVEEIEDVISGSATQRSGLDRLMGMVRKRAIDVVCVYKLDRLGRSLSHLVQVIAEMEGNKVALVCPGQGLDTSMQNPAGRLQMHVLMAVSEFERAMIRERTMAGLAVARAKGHALGRREVEKPAGWREKVMALRKVRLVAAEFGIGNGTASKWIKEAMAV